MTITEFRKKYPKGLKSTIVSFSKALYEIMTGSEIDHIIKATHGRERRRLKKFKAFYLENVKDWDTPFWPMVGLIDSPMLFADVITIMTLNDKRIYRGEKEDVDSDL